VREREREREREKEISTYRQIPSGSDRMEARGRERNLPFISGGEKAMAVIARAQSLPSKTVFIASKAITMKLPSFAGSLPFTLRPLPKPRARREPSGEKQAALDPSSNFTVRRVVRVFMSHTLLEREREREREREE
jgi:hypothetical protein